MSEEKWFNQGDDSSAIWEKNRSAGCPKRAEPRSSSILPLSTEMFVLPPAVRPQQQLVRNVNDIYQYFM